MVHIYNLKIHVVTDTNEDVCNCDISGEGSIAGVTKAIILSNLIKFFDLDYRKPLDCAMIETAIFESVKEKE